MSRPNPNSASDEGSDRPTTPGLGDDPRATLPEPLPPVRVPAEFSRTIPMGTSALTEWMASSQRRSSEAPGDAQSGVHALGPAPNAPESRAPNPVTKSDRVLAKGRTLHSFGAAPPPRIETDDKRWIGQDVAHAVPHIAPSLHTTQRSFTSAPPGDLPLPQSTFPSSAPPPPMNLGSTVRAMSVPPPAGSVPPPPLPRVAAPIVPSPTIKVSPEIAIGTRSPELTQAKADEATPETVVTSPTTSRPPALPPALPPRATSASPEAPAPSAPPRWAFLRPQVSRWSTARLLTVTFLFAAAAIAVLLVSTAPSNAPSAATAAVAEDAVPPTPQLPRTQIITNPPGAEIVLRGALVANSPASVVRPSYESLYLVRLRGYQPQLVALAPHSPDMIRIDLEPLAGSQPDITSAQPVTTHGQEKP